MLVMIRAGRDNNTPYIRKIAPPNNCMSVKGRLISLALLNLKSFQI